MAAKLKPRFGILIIGCKSKAAVLKNCMLSLFSRCKARRAELRKKNYETAQYYLLPYQRRANSSRKICLCAISRLLIHYSAKRRFAHFSCFFNIFHPDQLYNFAYCCQTTELTWSRCTFSDTWIILDSKIVW